MTDLEMLVAIEQIKTLKARYWRGVDTKDAAVWRGVFADDALIDFREDAAPGEEHLLHHPPPDTFVRHALAKLEGITTAHHGHQPEIQFVSDSEATAVWPMEDNLWVDHSVSKMPFQHLRGYGHYHDRYRKTAQGWKIAQTTLRRTRVDIS
jgi:hypothetical protein